MVCGTGAIFCEIEHQYFKKIYYFEIPNLSAIVFYITFGSM